MRLSVTSIKAYLVCPRRYRYAYIDRVPAVPTGPLAFGSAVHAAIHDLHRHCLETSAPMDADFGIAAFRHLWRESLERQRPLFKDGDATRQAYTQLGERIVCEYAQSHPAPPPTIALEYRFELPWRSHTLAGVVDRIDQGDHGLVIYELKTSQCKPTARELNTDLQLTVYAYAVQRVFQRPVERLVHYHLRGPQALDAHRSESSVRYLLGAVFPLVSEAVEGGMFSPTPGWHCRICDYRELCRAEREEPLRASSYALARPNHRMDAALESILARRPSPSAGTVV